MQHTRVAECAFNGGYICHHGTSFIEDVFLVEFMYLVFIYRMPGIVIVGDSGLCRCGSAFDIMCDVNCSRAITYPAC